MILLLASLGLTGSKTQAQALNISARPAPGSIAFFSPGKGAVIVTDDRGVEVTGIAAKALQHDIFLVTGSQPDMRAELKGEHPAVVIGTLGSSRIIDELASKKLIPAAQVRNKWETFCLAVIPNPLNPRSPVLVIFGSDPRGTAFGVFEFSKMLGVSPWVWWADVKPKPVQQIYIRPGKSIIGPPSVKYRGFFINDEDWGMRPWAAKQMDKELGDIGPRTYEQVFELMLRLKANYLWPAMHPGTKAFWYYKDNPLLARRYSILMGSSHHEPMLRDTEFEWNENFKEEYGKAHGDWRYDTNKEEIYRFFDDRVKQSVHNEAIYTVGMRATKDGGMQGPGGMQEKIKLLEKVIADQREILTHRLAKPANQVPQVFCPYKEVLEMYQAGLKIPEDVTITWVDDNHGYMRQLPNPAEQKRAGGGGVYYHFSYWGVPQDYLWLSSTSPVLAAFEMSKAYALHARNIWVFNVGDIKPAELELELAMDLAWNVNAWPPEKAYLYAGQWAGRTFGPEFAGRIGRIKSGYYQLAASGKPEHLNRIVLTDSEIKDRLDAYHQLVQECRQVEKLIPPRLKDAYFQLIAYPVEAASSMNEKIWYANESRRLTQAGDPAGLEFAEKAKAAYARIHQLSDRYNHGIANGKWNGMMDDHPRGGEIFNQPEFPGTDPKRAAGSDSGSGRVLSLRLPADRFHSSGNGQGRLKTIIGLGSTGKGLTVIPMQLKSYQENNINQAPWAEYQLPVRKGKNYIDVHCLPTFPLYPGLHLRYAVAAGGAKPVFVDISAAAESSTWAAHVLSGYAAGETVYESKTDQTIPVRIYFPDPGLVLSAVAAYASKN